MNKWGREIGYCIWKHDQYKRINVVIPEGRNFAVLTDISDGMSLTNSMELAIEQLCREFPFIIGRPLYQDCGSEGIFRVHYKASRSGGMQPTSRRHYFYDVIVEGWEHFSKDLTALSILYGKN